MKTSKGDEVVSLGKRLLPTRSGEAPFSFRRGPVKRRPVSGVILLGGFGVGSSDACHASLLRFRHMCVASHVLVWAFFGAVRSLGQCWAIKFFLGLSVMFQFYCLVFCL